MYLYTLENIVPLNDNVVLCVAFFPLLHFVGSALPLRYYLLASAQQPNKVPCCIKSHPSLSMPAKLRSALNLCSATLSLLPSAVLYSPAFCTAFNLAPLLATLFFCINFKCALLI